MLFVPPSVNINHKWTERGGLPPSPGPFRMNIPRVISFHLEQSSVPHLTYTNSHKHRNTHTHAHTGKSHETLTQV